MLASLANCVFPSYYIRVLTNYIALRKRQIDVEMDDLEEIGAQVKRIGMSPSDFAR